MVTNQNDFCACPSGVGDEAREGAGVDHPGFVDHQNSLGVEVGAVVTNL